MKHIVMFSGGVGSWAAAKRVAQAHGTDDLILLFADTLMEDTDLYRFIEEAAVDVGGRLVRTSDGRDVWDIFFDHRFLGNTRIDPCSRVLKRERMRDWIEMNYSPQGATVYLGIDWTESHRMDKAASHWVPWRVEAPLCDPPYLLKTEHLSALRGSGIEPPRLYSLGFEHNNCGGFCIKAGQAQFELLFRQLPERYLYHERREQELRDFLGKDVAILRDRRGGKTRPMTLREFRERLQSGADFDRSEWGACSCMVPA